MKPFVGRMGANGLNRYKTFGLMGLLSFFLRGFWGLAASTPIRAVKVLTGSLGLYSTLEEPYHLRG